ncbi:hypothetical protein AVEN_133293-1 [Araneus ventricosus]|uniref:Uncharacterized protein n=1 Tax=Araneus ventricosus TaxID=182803 RepID=A0A4Y2DJN8_ARAVE|nr:hypothetical protein AVEN_133293-1 [Araneus ventricosus]
MLESENIDVCSAVEMIDKTRQAMVKKRSDKGFEEVLVDTRDLCNSIETEAEFQEPEARTIEKKKQYDYESLDEASPKEIQAKHLFCFYFFILDVIINSLQESFEEIKAICGKTGLYVSS